MTKNLLTAIHIKQYFWNRRMISKTLAEILGLLCSEGCHVIAYSSYFGKERGKLRYHKNKRSERIEFYNKNKELLEHYKRLLKEEFNLDTNITKHGKINIARREVIRKIIEHTPLGHTAWKVPEAVMIGNDEMKIAFIRGFFDGDGTAINVARFFSTNEKGLRQISQVLNTLKILHTTQKPVNKAGRKPLYSIQISRKDYNKFMDMVQPIAKRIKEQDL